MFQTYYIYYGTGTEPLVNLGVGEFAASIFAVCLSVGVIFAVGGLFFVQVKYISSLSFCFRLTTYIMALVLSH